MNIFHKVTLKSLQKNKVRTVVTVIGIMLSAALVCAVTISISSVRNYALENIIYSDGSWHGSALGVDLDMLNFISTSDKVKNAVYGERIGYAVAENSLNTDKPYLFVLGAGEGFDDIMPVHLTVGNYPESTGEIILPEHLMMDGASHKLGETITLDIGLRKAGDVTLWQNEYYGDMGEETLETETTRKFTVVGFYSRPSFEGVMTPGYTAITLRNEQSDTALYDVYFTMEDSKDVYDFMRENGLSGSRNTDLLTFSGSSRYDSYYRVIYSLAAIVIGLIMFGSVSLIYNAFSISVSERTKQFGLLSSVGATKKQLRKTVFFEAFAVSAIGIPLGIIVGIVGIGVTLNIIGDRFAILSSFELPMRLSVSWTAVICACAVSLVTVLISAWIPSRRATKVSAVEAIRRNEDIKISSKKVKTSDLTYKLFGLPGVLAAKHFKRNRKKYRTTVMSLFMSIVLFVSASSFTDYLTESFSVGYDTYKYDIIYMGSSNDADKYTYGEMLSFFKQADKVEKATYTVRNVLGCTLSSDDVTEKWKTDTVHSGMTSQTETDPSLTKIDTIFFFVEDETYRDFLKENKLDESKFFDPDAPLAVAIDGQTQFSRKEEKFMTINLLENTTATLSTDIARTFEGYYISEHYTDESGEYVCHFRQIKDNADGFVLPYSEAYERYDMKIGKTLYDTPYFVTSSAGLTLLYPISLMERVLPESEQLQGATYVFTSSDHEVSLKSIREIAAANGLTAADVYDYAESAERDRDMIVIIKVFSYGFIVLISLIAAANVFNTISTNISLRRREFAMLKSVGMSGAGFNKMMNYECLMYGAKALLYGLPVSAGVTYLIYLSISSGYTSDFYLPWDAMGIAVISVFAVVFTTMLYSMRKIKKDNPIDALKNENI